MKNSFIQEPCPYIPIYVFKHKSATGTPSLPLLIHSSPRFLHPLPLHPDQPVQG